MKKILIIEDNPHLILYLTQKLTEAGHEVVTESTGLSAIHRLTGYKPDIIFVDYILPNVNGDKLCQIIRRMDHLKGSYLVLMSAATKELDLNPSNMVADAIIAKGTFKETIDHFFSVLATADHPPREKPPEGILGFDSVHPRRMTVELLEKNRHLQTMLDSISEGIVEIYRGEIVYANPAAATILGKPQDQLVTAQPSELFPESERAKVESVMRSEPNGKAGLNWEEPIELGWKIVSFKKLSFQGDPDTTILLFTDITEQKHTEAALQKYQVHLENIVEEYKADLKRANEKLQQVQKMEAIGLLAGGVAHDLNNILTALVGYPDLLLLNLPPDSPLRQIAITIKESGEKAGAVVQDLLAMARRGITTLEVVNLDSIIADYLESPEWNKLKSFHPEVVLESHLADQGLNILGSPVHLSKMIMNLATNATEAMPRGGTLRISTEARYMDRPPNIPDNEEVQEGEYVILTVSDSGVGIVPEDIKKIFDPFYTKKVMGRSGTGLGMTVVWGTVKDHKGFIVVESTVAKGTAIHLYFPVIRQELTPKKSKTLREEYIGKKESILIVDDSKDQREMVSAALSNFGYTVSMVSSGEEAVAYLKKVPADLIILDMIMDPGIDGLETLRQIREFLPDQKVIIASGYSDKDAMAACLSLGVGQYLKKPYTLDKIGVAVRQELDKKNQ